MKINVKDQVKINQVLENIQGRCSARTITANQIQQYALFAQHRLDMLMYKKDQPGVKVICDPNAQRVSPRSKSTIFVLQRGYRREWFLVTCIRDYVRSPTREIFFIVSIKHKLHIADHVLAYRNWYRYPAL